MGRRGRRRTVGTRGIGLGTRGDGLAALTAILLGAGSVSGQAPPVAADDPPPAGDAADTDTAAAPGTTAAPETPSATAAPARPVAQDAGVTVRVYDVTGDLQRVTRVVEGQTPNLDRLDPAIDLVQGSFGELPAPIVTEVLGWIVIPTTGAWEFRLTSDDGSQLRIDDRLVIDHDGRHGPTSVESGPLELEAGPHALRVDHFDSGGNRVLRLEWRRAGSEVWMLPGPDVLRTERDLTRVTSPGTKRLVGARRPGDGTPLDRVHPGWTVHTIRPEGFEPKVGSMAFLPDGRLIVGTFDPLQRDDRALPDIESKLPDRLYALRGVDGDPADVTVEVCAGGLYEPSGLCVLDGELYVAQRRAITRLRDLDGDGFFETHEPVAMGWEGWNYHQFVFCLVPIDGRLYAALSTTMAPPAWEGMQTNAGPNGPMRGCVIEIDPATGDVQVLASGTRTPNGLGVAPDGALLYAENQGGWMPVSLLGEVLPGRFFGHYNWTRFVPKLAERFPDGGHPSAWCDRPRAPAAILLPHGEIANSPTVPVTMTQGPFAGQMLLGELTAGGLRRVSLERVDGVLQGAVFRCTQGLESGVNRVVLGPDGSVYVGGIGAGGNWNWRGTQFGLQRLTPTGRTVLEMHDVSITPTGFRVDFTRALPIEWLSDPSNYTLTRFRYAPTVEYGGPKVDVRGLAVTAARARPDGRSVELVVEGVRPGTCVHLHVDATAPDGERIWSPDAWYTVERVPRATPPVPATLGTLAIDPGRRAVGPAGGRAGVGVGIQPPAGATVLLNGPGAPTMRHEGGGGNGARDGDWPAPRTQDAFIEADPWTPVGGGTGDLVSSTEFGDARLHVEWYAPPGGAGQLAGNSGVYVQERYEVQVLGTLGVADGGPEPPGVDEAGAIYGVKAPRTNASRGPGAWQSYDIWFRAPRFDAGRKIADARMTVYWNGVLIHDDVAIPSPTGAARAGGEAAADPSAAGGTAGAIQHGRLRLQDHASGAEGPVRYRNVWIAPLDPTHSGAPVLGRHAESADGTRQRPASMVAGPWRMLLLKDLEPARRQELTRDTESVAGWTIHGGDATYTWDGSVLTGQTRPNTPNTFFTTDATYDDFELVYEVRVDAELNSGVQIRSEVVRGAEAAGANASAATAAAPTPGLGLRGLQIEIDPSDRAFTGGVYEERDRGWLHPLHDAPYARRAFRPGDWNEIRVLAQGPRVRTWVNGVPAADIHDVRRLRGHIGFQVHGVGGREEPLEVEFRNVRLRSFVAAPPPRRGSDAAEVRLTPDE